MHVTISKNIVVLTAPTSQVMNREKMQNASAAPQYCVIVRDLYVWYAVELHNALFPACWLQVLGARVHTYVHVPRYICAGGVEYRYMYSRAARQML